MAGAGDCVCALSEWTGCHKLFESVLEEVASKLNPTERIDWLLTGYSRFCLIQNCLSRKIRASKAGVMHQVRILLVDDEPNIVLTMPLILGLHGFEVTAVCTVNEALAKITSAQFDVLISDLNIGEPDDGLVVVSAMRRTQPTCITLILTGYPGLQTALEAIQCQVDDYLIKPISVPTLINLIERKLKHPKPGTVADKKRISQILRESTFEITSRALKEMKSHPILGALPLADEQRIESIPSTLEELATILESAEPPEPTATTIIQGAAARCTRPYQLGDTLPLLATHVRLLERAIYDVIYENQQSLNLSYLMFDLKRLSDNLGLLLEYMQLDYLDAEQRVHRHSRA
jgi:CheY-like chemotaxis protein